MTATPLWLTSLIATIASIVANLLLRSVGLAILDIPAEVPPLAGAAPTILFTVIGVLAATLVWTGVRNDASRSVSTFRIIAIVALLVSFVPDVWLLTDGARSAFPGATLAGVSTLMAQHVCTATIVVWLITMRGRTQPE